MALEMNVEYGGVSFSAYIKITAFSGNNQDKTCCGSVGYYATNGDEIYPNLPRYFESVPLNEGQDIRDVIYEHIKSKPEYLDAVNV